MGTMQYSFSCSVGTLKTCDTCDHMTRSAINPISRCSPTTCGKYATEQFLLFAIAGKEEFHLHKAIQMGLVAKDFREFNSRGVMSETFLSSVPHFKVFVSLRGVRTRRRFFSFYIRMETDPMIPQTIISPFPESPVNSGFYFKGKFRFLKKKEVLNTVIDPNGQSASFLKSQKMLPTEVLKQMVKRDYSELRKGVRKLKI